MRLRGNLATGITLGIVLASSSPSQATTISISSNFNGTAIAAGNYIWFNYHIDVTDIGSVTLPVTLFVTNSSISFTANSIAYNLGVPNSMITLDPSLNASTAGSATTTFDTPNNRWVTTVPLSLNADDIFVFGLPFVVPAGGFPGGINPVVWTADFSSGSSGLDVSAQWAAAVYTSFSSNPNALGVKAVDSNTATIYPNSDQSGTPESFKSFVTGGARGGGGSNYTGSNSGTGSGTNITQIPEPGSLSLLEAGALLVWLCRRRAIWSS